MRSYLGAAGAAVVLVVGAFGGVATADGKPSVGSSGFTLQDPRITESSGLAASRAHPGIYWTHNDSDDGAYLYAIDGRTGKTVATLTLTGVGAPRDVEAISIGPDGDLYVGDIGDNLGGKWDHVWIYKLPEPKKLVDQTVRATQYVVKYADGPRNAESLMVHPKTGRVYIIEKGEDGGGLYEGPATLDSAATNTFKRIADIDLWATDAAFSPDGRQLAVRGYFGGIAYSWNDGKPERQGQLSVPMQPQGESVTYTLDGKTLLYGSEGKGSSVEPVEVEGASGDSGGANGSGGSGSSGSSGGDGGGFRFTGKAGAVGAAVVLIAVIGIGRLLRKPRQR
ncbi:WD40 repeat domain-containing protein [Streptomyces sp. VRA16 Mangrove soil]|uniref:WD40 repeat domain-containing protein n=1 Tax=Streptomyces sp. VRA16 Mangrove soil TaxID=2817434 RepID=UPI001A9EC27E|nr:WD40 repeat domain-containing protein [Streptomyces sp. VRA16 Mangrove soil]MBO1337613.1 WD40 repeat domain-containing protein [Streptomyces sp. VRA16 Mangrove soil]